MVTLTTPHKRPQQQTNAVTARYLARDGFLALRE
jgi:hypothetical protein